MVRMLAVISLLLVAPATLLAQAVTPRQSERYALLVAVREYPKAKLGKLRFAENDMEQLALTLRSAGYKDENIVRLSFTVGGREGFARYLPNGENIRRELQILLGNLGKSDSLIVAFSGHGVQFQGEKEAYFCPSDADLERTETLISVSDLYAQLKASPVRLKVLFIDACRNDPAIASSKGPKGVELEAVGKPQEIEPPQGIVALYSCSAGQKAWEDTEFRHGVFFNFVIAGLKGAADFNKDGQVSYDELSAYSIAEVKRHARVRLGELQVPQQKGEYDGQIALVRVERPIEPPTTPSQPVSGGETKFLSNIRQVTTGYVKAGEGYFSPDGKQIIYQAVRAEYPFYQIYTQPLAGGEPKLVSRGRGRTTCAFFHPDGNKILFASSHLDPALGETEAAARKQEEEDKKSGTRRRYQWDFDPHMDIFEADLDGKILRNLTHSPGYDAEGAWSRDGKTIAFCSMRDGDPDLYIMDADGKNVRQLTNVAGYDGGPFQSPDGKWIVFRSDRKEKDQLQIYVIGSDGQNETAITDTNGVNWAPYWHPTKPYLIWTGADHSNPQARPNYDLWLMKYQIDGGKFTGGKPIRITDAPSADVLPVFSPDGTKLMWTSGRTEDHSSQLFIADFKLPE